MEVRIVTPIFGRDTENTDTDLMIERELSVKISNFNIKSCTDESTSRSAELLKLKQQQKEAGIDL